MRFFNPVILMLAASHKGSTAPTTDVVTDVIDIRSVNEANLVLETLERRATCASFHRVLHTIGTSQLTVIFITLGTGLTRSVCSYVHGQDCGDLAYIIQAGLGLVYVAAGYFSGAVDVTLPIRRDIDNGGDTGIHAEYRDWLHDAIDASSGLSFDDITSLPFDPALAALAKRDTADPDLVTRVQITGLRVSNGTSTTPAQDVVVNLFADNTTVLHLPVISSSSYPTDGLGKRVNSPGFKISFTTRIPSKLSYTHMQEMALVGAMDWGSAAGQYPMNEWIGLAKTNHDANFYYRIIPETFSMDYSYESVDICGQMGVYL